MHASGGEGIETGQLTAGSVERQRKLLCAVAKKVAAVDVVVLIDPMINLRDDAAQIVKRGRDGGVIGGKVSTGVEAAAGVAIGVGVKLGIGVDESFSAVVADLGSWATWLGPFNNV